MLERRAAALDRDHVNVIIFRPGRRHPAVSLAKTGLSPGFNLRQRRAVDDEQMRESGSASRSKQISVTSCPRKESTRQPSGSSAASRRGHVRR